MSHADRLRAAGWTYVPSVDMWAKDSQLLSFMTALVLVLTDDLEAANRALAGSEFAGIALANASDEWRIRAERAEAWIVMHDHWRAYTAHSAKSADDGADRERVYRLFGQLRRGEP